MNKLFALKQKFNLTYSEIVRAADNAFNYQTIHRWGTVAPDNSVSLPFRSRAEALRRAILKVLGAKGVDVRRPSVLKLVPVWKDWQDIALERTQRAAALAIAKPRRRNTVTTTGRASA